MKCVYLICFLPIFCKNNFFFQKYPWVTFSAKPQCNEKCLIDNKEKTYIEAKPIYNCEIIL